MRTRPVARGVSPRRCPPDTACHQGRVAPVPYAETQQAPHTRPRSDGKPAWKRGDGSRGKEADFLREPLSLKPELDFSQAGWSNYCCGRDAPDSPAFPLLKRAFISEKKKRSRAAIRGPHRSTGPAQGESGDRTRRITLIGLSAWPSIVPLPVPRRGCISPAPCWQRRGVTQGGRGQDGANVEQGPTGKTSKAETAIASHGRAGDNCRRGPWGCSSATDCPDSLGQLTSPLCRSEFPSSSLPRLPGQKGPILAAGLCSCSGYSCPEPHARRQQGLEVSSPHAASWQAAEAAGRVRGRATARMQSSVSAAGITGGCTRGGGMEHVCMHVSVAEEGPGSSLPRGRTGFQRPNGCQTQLPGPEAMRRDLSASPGPRHLACTLQCSSSGALQERQACA